MMENKIRFLTNKEQEIVNALISVAGSKWEFLKNDISIVTVTEMKDGGMGSLLFYPENLEKRTLGVTICEAEFLDVDGVTVSVVINLDQNNRLFELDVWKVNFEPLISLPDLKNLESKKIGRYNPDNVH